MVNMHVIVNNEYIVS